MGFFQSLVNWYKYISMSFHLIPIAFSLVKCKFLLRCRHKRSVDTEEEEDVENQVIVITGANRGLGKQLALEFAKRRAIVVLGCRDMAKGLQTKEEIIMETGNYRIDVFHLDLINMDSVEHFALTVRKKHKRIKILINNAALLGAASDMNNTTLLMEEECNSILTVNHLGPFLLTNLLLERLQNGAPSRVVMISSAALLFSEFSSNNLSFRKYGYSMLNNIPYCNSKHCNTLFSMELAERVKELGITAYSLCPGMVNTDIFTDYNGILRCAINLFKIIAATTPAEAVKEFVLPVSLWKKLTTESGKMYMFAQPFHKVNKRISKEVELSAIISNHSAYLTQLDERRKRLHLHKSVCI